MNFPRGVDRLLLISGIAELLPSFGWRNTPFETFCSLFKDRKDSTFCPSSLRKEKCHSNNTNTYTKPSFSVKRKTALHSRRKITTQGYTLKWSLSLLFICVSRVLFAFLTFSMPFSRFQKQRFKKGLHF